MISIPALEKALTLEQWFAPFHQAMIGTDHEFITPYGKKKIYYADWTASGRLYGPIEDLLRTEMGPLIGNTHTETTVTGCTMTMAYHRAKEVIKRHVGASHEDILIASNSGMTGVINKFQRILGLRVHERYRKSLYLKKEDIPVVFVTHMEHHSNHTSWLETIADVEIIQPDPYGQVDLDHLEKLLGQYQDRKLKIAAVTACSNVTGIQTPYHEIAEIMHLSGGFCFVDFACSAPYIDIVMRPVNALQRLDAIYFSPHKFLGGPGSSGILIFDPQLYQNRVPDHPGGGTVYWTDPWTDPGYLHHVEEREDGGTPAFLQTIKAALAMRLKERMNVEKMLHREHELMDLIWKRLDKLPRLHILADHHRNRLGIVSFYIEGLHYNLGVKILNDRFGIQVRGGCSCAGTYGHFLFDVDRETSHKVRSQIENGILSVKPGWIRLSIHPVMKESEIDFILDAIEELHDHHTEWALDYTYHDQANEFRHHSESGFEAKKVEEWFSGLSL